MSYRGGYRSFGYRRRFGYRRGYNRFWRRRGWYRRGGVSRAQATGERRFKLVVPVNYTFSFALAQGANTSLVLGTNPYTENTGANAPLRCMCSLASSDIYRTYATLYDEVKVDWASMSLSCMENIGANVSSVTVVTGIDRRCTASEAASPVGQEWPSYAQLLGSGTSERFVMNSLTKKTVRRFIRASDLNERTNFHDCTVVTFTSGGLNFQCDNAYYNEGAAAHTVNFFAPSFQIGIQLPQPAPAGGFTVTFDMEIKYGVTFRGPKYGMVAASGAKVVDTEQRRVEIEGAGKSVSKPTLTGMAKDVVARLALNVSDNCDEYVSGENDWHEDLEFLISKVGIDGVRSYFPEGVCKDYDDYLKERGVMDDDPTELVKDSKS